VPLLSGRPDQVSLVAMGDNGAQSIFGTGLNEGRVIQTPLDASS
jgi:hypothetical protein